MFAPIRHFMIGLAFVVSIAAAIAQAPAATPEPIPTDAPPYVTNGVTMVPMRAIFEWLGATVTFDANAQKITARKDARVVFITIGKNTATVDDITVHLAVPAQTQNNRSYVPLRFVAEAFGAKVTWDSTQQRATINIEQKLGVLAMNTKPVSIRNQSNIKPSSADSLEAQADIFMTTGEDEQAIEDYTKALESSRNTSNVLFKRGQTLLHAIRNMKSFTLVDVLPTKHNTDNGGMFLTGTGSKRMYSASTNEFKYKASGDIDGFEYTAAGPPSKCCIVDDNEGGYIVYTEIDFKPLVMTMDGTLVLWSAGCLHKLPKKVVLFGHTIEPIDGMPFIFEVTDRGYTYRGGSGTITTRLGKKTVIDIEAYARRALADMDKVITGDISNTDAHYYKGNALCLLGKTDDALAEYRKFINMRASRTDDKTEDANKQITALEQQNNAK